MFLKLLLLKLMGHLPALVLYNLFVCLKYIKKRSKSIYELKRNKKQIKYI